MDLPLSDLPDDVDALKAMVLALAREQAAKEVRLKVAEAEIARLEAVEKSANERIANLTLIMKVLQRTQNGKRSERLRLGVNDEQVSFAFEEVETGLSAIRSELDRAAKDKPKRAPRPRKGFAAHLERIEEVIEPEIPAGCEGLAKVLIGEDRSERLDVVPPKFRVIVTRRPKYAFRGNDGVLQALAPAHIIESGLPTERLLAYIAVSKYADGLPLYRQEAIYLRDGVEISRSLMAQWMGHLGFELQICADYILERVKEGERIFADETTCQLLRPARGKRRRPGFGHMLAMIAPMAEPARRWWPIGLRTVGAPIAWRVISPDSAASCRWTATPPIPVSPRRGSKPAATKRSNLQDVGHIYGASFTICTSAVSLRPPQTLSWQ